MGLGACPGGEWVNAAESHLSRSGYCLSEEGEWSQLC